jgi:hypothetical protein
MEGEWMRNSRLRRKYALSTAVVTAFVLSVSVSSASAVEWVQGETSMRWLATDLTLTKDGGSPVSCETETVGLPHAFWKTGAMPGGIGGVAVGGYGYLTELFCDGGKILELCACIEAQSTTSVRMFNRWSGWTWKESPYGQYLQKAAFGTFANGNAEKPSTLTFENDLISEGEASPVIRISGTIEVTQEDESLLTLK